MNITENMMKNFSIIMRIYWDDICVAIFGYNSESKFYTDFINEMDNLITNGHIEVMRFDNIQLLYYYNGVIKNQVENLKGDFEMEFENVIKSFNQYKNFSEYDESEWDYFEDDEFYERTNDWNVPYDGEDWSDKFDFTI